VSQVLWDGGDHQFRHLAIDLRQRFLRRRRGPLCPGRVHLLQGYNTRSPALPGRDAEEKCCLLAETNEDRPTVIRLSQRLTILNLTSYRTHFTDTFMFLFRLGTSMTDLHYCQRVTPMSE